MLVLKQSLLHNHFKGFQMEKNFQNIVKNPLAIEGDFVKTLLDDYLQEPNKTTKDNELMACLIVDLGKYYKESISLHHKQNKEWLEANWYLECDATITAKSDRKLTIRGNTSNRYGFFESWVGDLTADQQFRGNYICWDTFFGMALCQIGDNQIDDKKVILGHTESDPDFEFVELKPFTKQPM